VKDDIVEVLLRQCNPHNSVH